MGQPSSRLLPLGSNGAARNAERPADLVLRQASEEAILDDQRHPQADSGICRDHRPRDDQPGC